MNDAERLAVDPAMRHVVGGRAAQADKEAATSEEPANEEATTSRSSQAWAMLIKRALSTNNLAKWTHCLVRSAVAR